MQRAVLNARCDYSIYVGASYDNYDIIGELAPLAAGLKMYLNETFTSHPLADLTSWLKVGLVDRIRMKNYTRRDFVRFVDMILWLSIVSLISAFPKLAKEISSLRSCRGPNNGRGPFIGWFE